MLVGKSAWGVRVTITVTEKLQCWPRIWNQTICAFLAPVPTPTLDTKDEKDGEQPTTKQASVWGETVQGADRLCLCCLAGAAAPFLSSVTFCLVTISQIERQQMIKLSNLTCIDWQCTLVDRFIIGPRCPWGPIYGSGSLSQTNWDTFCRLNWCDSGWWRYQLDTNW